MASTALQRVLPAARRASQPSVGVGVLVEELVLERRAAADAARPLRRVCRLLLCLHRLGEPHFAADCAARPDCLRGALCLAPAQLAAVPVSPALLRRAAGAVDHLLLDAVGAARGGAASRVGRREVTWLRL
eukprot:1266081-Pleurochrysis_carterae.AAC.2